MAVIKQGVTFSIRDTAKMSGFPGGEYRFFEWLRSRGYLLENNTPAQAYINRGWFVLVISKRLIGDIQNVIPVSRVTVKGLYGLHKVIKRDFPICKPCGDGK